MKREIKFRGKRLDIGEWHYGDLTTKKISHRFSEDTCIFDGGWHVVDPSTVGQYTGLKDKNGKEIFEGDIVESVFEPIRPTENNLIILGVVEWWNERAEFFVNCNNLDGFDLSTIQNISGYKYADGRFKMTFATKGKVVGNINDNPELLKGGEE